ncbi:MAG: hypothetical protein IAF38_09720 [Bacteroidia bacterium]|nr:hypothetical protein [Bacteroidia bacterium]
MKELPGKNNEAPSPGTGTLPLLKKYSAEIDSLHFYYYSRDQYGNHRYLWFNPQNNHAFYFRYNA